MEKDLKLEDCQLMFGDCLERMKEIPDGSIDLTVTSPPYDCLRSYNNNIDKSWTNKKWEPIIKELYRVTRNGIEANVRTLRAGIANETMQQTFTALGYKYVKFFNVLDGRTSKKCAFYSNKVYSIDEPHPVPPLHPNCRSLLIGVSDKEGKLEG